jgi:prephenate dehydrogenase
MPHFLNMVFGKMLINRDLCEVIKFAGTTFSLQLLITEAIYNEDPELYYEIQSQNTAYTHILDTFLESIKETALTIKRKDRVAYLKSFKKVKEALAKDPKFHMAYKRFYKAYEAIE